MPEWISLERCDRNFSVNIPAGVDTVHDKEKLSAENWSRGGWYGGTLCPIRRVWNEIKPRRPGNTNVARLHIHAYTHARTNTHINTPRLQQSIIFPVPSLSCVRACVRALVPPRPGRTIQLPRCHLRRNRRTPLLPRTWIRDSSIIRINKVRW